MSRKIEAHHRAWLAAHPDRTEEWLLASLREGFDVHHLDGDHDNNDALNLVLVEHLDHMMLHNGVRKMNRLSHVFGAWKPTEEVRQEREKRGRGAYESRLAGKKWRDIAVEIGLFQNNNKLYPNGSRANQLARDYSKALGLPWPI